MKMATLLFLALLSASIVATEVMAPILTDGRLTTIFPPSLMAGSCLVCLVSISAFAYNLGKASALASPATHATSIPDGYALMPRRLTAENGAKGLLLGEFHVEAEHFCNECPCDDISPTCEVCHGDGEYTQRIPVPWDTTKEIYAKAVAGLSLPPERLAIPSHAVITDSPHCKGYSLPLKGEAP